VKIAHLSQYFQPKIGYNDLYLPLKQQETGHEVCVITSDRYMPNTRFFGNVMAERIVGTGTFREEGILTYRLPCLLEIKNVGLLVRGIKKALSMSKPDVVHCHDVISTNLIAVAFHKKSLDYAFVADSITGTFHPDKARKMAYLFYKYSLFPYIANKVDKFIAITDGAQRWLSEEIGVATRRIELIPLGADMNLFVRNIARRKGIRQALGLSDDAVLIVYSGKIIPEKELEVLVQAVSSLPLDLKRKVHMLLVGNGRESYTERISKLADRQGLSNKLHLHPAVHRIQLPDYYSSADIAIWPGTPSNSIIEAMSTELPIIIAKYQSSEQEAQDTSSLFSYQYDTSNLLEYNNGLRFSRGSFEQLAKCIEKLAEDEKLRRNMGLEGRRLVEEKLNWNEISKKTLELYKRILSSHRSDPADIA